MVDPACSQFNAPGNDNTNKVEEYACFTNRGASPVDMSGWVVKDEYGWTYTFPPFTLPPGASVRLRTGCGINTEQDLYWCKDETAVWNNDGDYEKADYEFRWNLRHSRGFRLTAWLAPRGQDTE